MLFPFWSGAPEPWKLELSRDPQEGAALHDVPMAVAVPGWVLLPAAQGWGSCRAVPAASTRNFFIKTVWTKTGLEILETPQVCGTALAALSLLILACPKGPLRFLLQQFLSEFSVELMGNVPLLELQIHYFSPDPKHFPSSSLQQDEALILTFFMVNGVGGNGGITKEWSGIWVNSF